MGYANVQLAIYARCPPERSCGAPAGAAALRQQHSRTAGAAVITRNCSYYI